MGSGLALAVCAAATIYVQSQGTASAAPDTIVSVDFGTVVAQSPPENFGVTFSTFGVEGGPVAKSPDDIAALRGLGVGGVRVHLKPDGKGGVVSGAGGGDTSVTGDEWLSAIEQIGAEPTVIVNTDPGDALTVLDYLRQHGHQVKRFIIGNEMDANSKSNLPADQYTSAFRQIASLMRQVVPDLEIGGPAPAYFAEDLLRTFIDGAVRDALPQERASFIDYHAYGAGAGENATVASSTRYIEQLDRLRGMLGAVAPQVGLQLGEFNMNWGDESQNNTHFASVWVANALGSIVTRGATALVYADKNNAMGVVGPKGAPKASYVGMEMFTGSPLGIRHFGRDVVQSSSNNPNVYVYASNNEANIVIVNTGPAGQARVDLAGALRGSVDIWQSSGPAQSVNRPALTGSANITDGRVNAFLPGMSITTLVVNGLVTRPDTPGASASPGASATAAPSGVPTTSSTASPAPASPGAPGASTAPPATSAAPSPPSSAVPTATSAPGGPATPGTVPGTPVPSASGAPRYQLPALGDPRWRNQGTAAVDAGGAVLTRPDQRFASGSVYYETAVPAGALQASFDVAINGGNGGDGLTFALLDPGSPSRLGETGGGLGYSGLNGTAVVLDTFDNTTNKPRDTVGVATGAQGTTMRYAASAASAPTLRNATRHVDVTVDAGVLTVRIDGTVVARAQTQLPDRVVLAFTAATGETTDQHRVSNVRITHGG